MNTSTQVVNVFVQTNMYHVQDKQYLVLLIFSYLSRLTVPESLLPMHFKDYILFKEGYSYVKCGITLTELIPKSQIQFGLFDKINLRKEKKLMVR